ncbi:MAG: hypothetical protein KAT68_12165 [Bacteroidales bacterium]|nr:hypothetical protein [Bacteroidales bacterium]
MKKTVLLILVLCATFRMFAQDEEKEQDYGIKFSGFVKNDFFYDSRQIYDIRDRHFLFFPKPISKDVYGDDINANPSINFLSIQSRLKGTITGPDAFGAKTSGILEADFFGNVSNIFRLRHAIVKFNWTNTELITGQYWHPMFVTGCFPGTVSFSTGVPFQPFSRNPQIRVTQKFGSLNVIAAAMTQRDFSSPGGYSVLSNSGLPDLHGQVQFTSGDIFAGGGLGYKILKPSLTDALGNKSDATVGGVYAIGFAKIKIELLTIKVEGIYGQNMHDLLMTNGYAYSKFDITNGDIEYTPMNNISLWTDVHTNGKEYQVGLFVGYMKNLGANKDLVADPGGNMIFTRFNNDMLDYAFRISPRIIFNSGKTRIAGEIEYTGAAYVTTDDQGNINMNSKGKITDSETVGNLRLLLAVYYFF